MTGSTGTSARRSRRGTLGTAATALGLGLLLTAAGAAPAFATTAPTPDPASSTEPAPARELVAQSLSLLADSAEGTPTGGIDPTLGVTFDEQGRIAVIVAFDSADALGSARAAVSELGEIVTTTESQPTYIVRALPTDLDSLAALPGVTSVSPVLPGVTAGGASASALAAPQGAGNTACNPLDVEADAPAALNSAAARERFGVDGTGVKVGIISDSFAIDKTAYRSYADDVSVGALPGAANPCGYTTEIDIVQEGAAGVTQTTDEGRAMAQLVHGVAPGAELLFASMGGSEAAFADSIDNLVEAGADIILDDASFGTEPLVQEGIVGTHARTAVEKGVLYLSAAQNMASIGQASDGPEPGYRDGMTIGSWNTEAYTPTACTTVVESLVRDLFKKDDYSYDCQNFARAGENPFLPATLALPEPPPGVQATGTLMAQWSQPVWNVETAFVLVVTDATGAALVPQNPQGSGTAAYTASTFAPTTPSDAPVDFSFSLVRVNVPGSPELRPAVRIQFMLDDAGVMSLGDGKGWPDDVKLGPTIWGHMADPAVLTVGAASVLTPDTIEPYSGIGPVRYLWEPATPKESTPVPIVDPVTRSKPDVVSVDQSLTTFFPDGAAGDFRFGGTSAATPNAGAVAALGLEYSPDATAEQLRHALVSTATPMPEQRIRNAKQENVTGSGRIEAVNALAALPAPAPTPTPTPTPDAGGDNRLADTGADVAGTTGGLIGMAAIIAAGIALVALGRATALGGRGRRG